VLPTSRRRKFAAVAGSWRIVVLGRRSIFILFVARFIACCFPG
jgi:hypothetical protein